MEKIEVILVKGKETKGTYVYEEELGYGGKPPVLKTQYIQKWWSLFPGDSRRGFPSGIPPLCSRNRMNYPAFLAKIIFIPNENNHELPQTRQL